jgi:hypothetical protein
MWATVRPREQIFTSSQLAWQQVQQERQQEQLV